VRLCQHVIARDEVPQQSRNISFVYFRMEEK